MGVASTFETMVRGYENYTTSLGNDDFNLDTNHRTNITTLINTRGMIPRRVT
jgi:hypothetical protein